MQAPEARNLNLILGIHFCSRLFPVLHYRATAMDLCTDSDSEFDPLSGDFCTDRDDCDSPPHKTKTQ
jgi:hypothetical protein